MSKLLVQAAATRSYFQCIHMHSTLRQAVHSPMARPTVYTAAFKTTFTTKTCFSSGCTVYKVVRRDSMPSALIVDSLPSDFPEAPGPESVAMVCNITVVENEDGQMVAQIEGVSITEGVCSRSSVLQDLIASEGTTALPITVPAWTSWVEYTSDVSLPLPSSLRVLQVRPLLRRSTIHSTQAIHSSPSAAPTGLPQSVAYVVFPSYIQKGTIGGCVVGYNRRLCSSTYFSPLQVVIVLGRLPL